MTGEELMPGKDGRTLTVIGAEIREHAAMLEYHMKGTIWEAVEIGRRLTEARDQTAHGDWMDFLKRETPFSYRKANNLIQVFEAYGDRQTDLFQNGPGANLQTYANLSFSQALELLALPAEERETFAAEKNVEDMSVRELREAIRERDEARRALEEEKQVSEGAALRIAATEAALDASQKETETARQDISRVRDELARERKRTADLAGRLDAARVMAADAAEERDAAKEEAERADRAAKLLNDGLERERQRADTAEAEAEQARAERDTAEKSRRKMEADMRLVNAELEAARKEPVPVEMAVDAADAEKLEEAYQRGRDAVREELEAEKKAEIAGMERSLKARYDADMEALKKELEAASAAAGPSRTGGDQDLAMFHVVFNQVQSQINQLNGLLLKVRGRDVELAEKLRQALCALADAVKGVAET